MVVFWEMSYIVDFLFIYFILFFNLIRIYFIDYFISLYLMKNDFLKMIFEK